MNEIKSLISYIDAMQQLGRDELIMFVRELKIRFNNFNDIYNAFLSLINETNKYIEENTIIKK